MTQRFLLICGLLILTGGIVFYFYQRHTTPPEPIIVYKSVMPPPITASPARITQAEIPPANDTHAVSPPILNEEHALNEGGYEAEVDNSPTQNESDLASDTTTDLVEESLSITEATVEVPEDPEAWITEQLEIIGATIEEKYPEIYALGTMSSEEVYKRYPTAKSREQLAVLAQEAQSEFFGDLSQLLSRLPSDLREEYLMTLETLLSKNWGDDAAREMVEIIRRDLDL